MKCKFVQVESSGGVNRHLDIVLLRFSDCLKFGSFDVKLYFHTGQNKQHITARYIKRPAVLYKTGTVDYNFHHHKWETTIYSGEDIPEHTLELNKLKDDLNLYWHSGHWKVILQAYYPYFHPNSDSSDCIDPFSPNWHIRKLSELYHMSNTSLMRWDSSALLEWFDGVQERTNQSVYIIEDEMLGFCPLTITWLENENFPIIEYEHPYDATILYDFHSCTWIKSRGRPSRKATEYIESLNRNWKNKHTEVVYLAYAQRKYPDNCSLKDIVDLLHPDRHLRKYSEWLVKNEV